MVVRLALVALFVSACTAPGPTAEQGQPGPAEPVAAVKAEPGPAEPVAAAKAEPGPAGPVAAAEVEPGPAGPVAAAEPDDEDEPDEDEGPAPVVFADGSTPVFVMLAGAGSRTKKPVRSAVLGHSWGWSTATEAAIRACERENDGEIGKMMWCSTEDKPDGAEALVSRLKLRHGRSRVVERADVAGWEVPAPASPVWLIGPRGVCAAAVGRPLVGMYSIDEDGERLPLEEHFTILELAWELTGCDAANAAWAPVGVVAPAVDPALRWVKVEASRRERFDPATWTGALANELKRQPEAAKEYAEDEGLSASGEPTWWMQTFALPGSDVRELFVAATWREPESERAPGQFGCGDDEYDAVYQYRGAADDPKILGRRSRGSLVGGLVSGGEGRYMIWSGSDEVAIAQVDAQGLGRPVRIVTGASHPEGGGEAGYSVLGYCGP
mgnify:CR=1 FL=1